MKVFFTGSFQPETLIRDTTVSNVIYKNDFKKVEGIERFRLKLTLGARNKRVCKRVDRYVPVNFLKMYQSDSRLIRPILEAETGGEP